MNNFKKTLYIIVSIGGHPWVCITAAPTLAHYQSVSSLPSNNYESFSDDPFNEIDNPSPPSPSPTNYIPLCIRRAGLKILIHWTALCHLLKTRYHALKKSLIYKKR